MKGMLLAFLGGGMLYWVVASKAMFFHNYYTLIIMIGFSLLAAAAVSVLINAVPAQLKWLTLFLVTALIVSQTYEANAKRLGRYEDLSAVSEFIMANTEEGDLILYEGYYTPLVIYTGRGLVRAARLADPRVRARIEKYGFAETMRRLHIKYLLTPYDEPTYRDFAGVFREINVKTPMYNRTFLICKRVRMECEGGEMEHKKLDGVVQEEGIPAKFKLVARIGKIKLYSFRN